MAGRKIREAADGALAKMREIGYSEHSIADYARLFRAYAALADERGEAQRHSVKADLGRR